MAELEHIAAVLESVRDVLAERVETPETPAWAARRGWAPYLLAMTDEEVARAEQRGLWSVDVGGAPADLRRLCDTTLELIGPFADGPSPAHAVEHEHVPLRKRSQVAALVAELRSRRDVLRIVDMGAGHGHLSRAARAVLGVEVMGVDRDGERLDVARALAGDEGLTFVQGSPETVAMRSTDLVIGLHACGAFGDALLRRAQEAGASVLLVSCCLQKIDEATRTAMSAAGEATGLSFPRKLVGLSNLSWGASAGQGLRSREVRHALRLLLRKRGREESIGDVARGVHKRRFRRDLSAVAALALARRGMAPPTPDEIAACQARGAQEFSVIRRLSLPRNMLGRLMELAIVRDRGCFLEERGYSVRLHSMFHPDISPRNIGLIGHLQASAKSD